eukprot:1187817-Prorocentrum_minimum.AAC.9
MSPSAPKVPTPPPLAWAPHGRARAVRKQNAAGRPELFSGKRANSGRSGRLSSLALSGHP